MGKQAFTFRLRTMKLFLLCSFVICASLALPSPTGRCGLPNVPTYFFSCAGFGGSAAVCCDGRYAEALHDMCAHPQVEGTKCVTNTTLGADSEYCLHNDSDGKKCYEGCSTGQFKRKGLTSTGKCPIHFNTIDSTEHVQQCPDGVTNVKYCKGHVLNVTMVTKGKAGICYHNEDATDHKCYEACAFKEFKDKGFTSGYCPDKYNLEESNHQMWQCPDGVTNLKYCQATKVSVTVRVIGMK